MPFDQEKRPNEVVPSGINFARRLADLPDGESIDNASVVITDPAGVDVTNQLLVGAVVINGTQVRCQIQAGVGGQRYHEAFLAYTTPGGYRLQEDIFLEVKEASR